jgi:hypothetical protein
MKVLKGSLSMVETKLPSAVRTSPFFGAGISTE